MSARADRTLRVALALPPGWWELPVLAHDLHAALSATVDRRLAFAPDVADARDVLISDLEAATGQARKAGAVFAAQIGVRAGQGPAFFASMIVALEPLPGVTEPAELAAMVQDLHQGAERRVRIEQGDLGPLGSIVRRSAIRRFDDGLEALSVAYYIPSGAIDETIIVTCTSSDIDGQAGALELLDAIVSTIDVTAAERVGEQLRE